MSPIPFRERLQQANPILGDGAMGTLLHQHGVPINTCFDELNLTHPEQVERIHRDYVEAGAELIETNTLISALNRGRPGMAAVDVFDTEPVLQGHALLRLENCICTPHIGYVEQNNYEKLFGAAFDNVTNFIKGTPTNIVNPGALQVRR